MTPEEIQRELDSLWSKVTSGTPPVAPAMPLPISGEQYSLHDAPAITREVTLETLSLVKRQHRAEVTRLAHLLELKERSLAETMERLRLTAAELERLRRREERVDALTTQQAMAYSAELEAAQEAQKAAQARLAEEESRLRSIAEESRRRVASEETRWRALEADWAAREAEYLMRLRELEARAEKERESSASALGAEQRALSELGEAKGAIEASLGELLKERREREEAEKERGRALQRVKDVEERMNELQNLFTEERKAWQELWERERSAWEAKKQELSAWEARVHEEKESFHQKFGQLEEAETRHAQEMTEILRRSSDAGSRIADFMREAAAKAAEMTSLKAPAAQGPVLPRIDRRWLAVAAAAALMFASAVPAWKAMHKLSFTLKSSHNLSAARTTAIAYDGDTLWVAEWEGGLLAFEAENPAEPIRREIVGVKGPYHPAALSSWAGKMYALDAAQARVLRFSVETPDKVESSWPTPGPAPAALAHDGQNLWSYDAATKVLYRHLGEGPEAQTESFRLDFDAVLTAIRWHKGELWAWDAKGKQVLVLKKKERSFDIAQAAPLPTGAQSLLLTYRADEKQVQRLELWVLATLPSGDPLLNKYLVRR